MILEAAHKYYSKLHEDLLVMQHYIKNNVAVFITILYLLGSIAGVIYLATLLNNFSVNVFQHIELTDFLLALLSHPVLVLTYTGFIMLVAIAYAIELKRIPDPKKPTLWLKIYHSINYPIYLLNPIYSIFSLLFLVLCIFSFSLAVSDSKKIKNKITQNYSLSLNEPIQQNKLTLLVEVQIVTSTARNLFVYDNKQDKLLIIPQNNIAALIPIIEMNKDVKTKPDTEQIKTDKAVLDKS
ncbi:hypothetical protein [Colwellia piezophila]|uniref:hypothetical protein n=1 Tax=Colwellia piezophila TaxID=211668 RepID=UPI00038261AB|nr:hypothetical protein [Colwellia piezophila]